MRRLNLTLTVPAITLLLIAFTGVLSAKDVEKRVKLKDLPPAVQETVKAQQQGATVLGITQETENGQIHYELNLKVNGHEKDVTIDPAGAVVSVEEEVALDSLPPAVKAEFERIVGKGKITKLESVTKGNTLAFYEAQVKMKGKTQEVKVGPDGKQIKE